MTLRELKNAIDTALQFEKNPENIDVVITAELPFMTCGQRPCVDVKCVKMGFDWEQGQFRIEPKETLMAVKHDIPQQVIKWNGNYHCPKCEYMISKGLKADAIKFCSKCGQAVKWE